jgi:hypothetical protein
VFVEYDEKVANFFAVTLAFNATLVSIDAGIAPKRQESAISEPLQISLGHGDAFSAIREVNGGSV